MRYRIKVTGKYSTRGADSKEDAEAIALHHFAAELQRWKDGMDLPKRMFDIEVTEVEE